MRHIPRLSPALLSRLWIAVFAVAVSPLALAAQDAPQPQKEIITLSQYIADADPKTRTYDGITLAQDGAVYFTGFNRKQGLIYRTTMTSGKPPVPVSVVLPDGGRPGGMTEGPEGLLWFTDYRGKRIFKMKPGETLKPEVHSTHPSMTQPQDLVVTAKGDIYVTDPNWRGRSGRIWRVPAKDKSAQVVKEGLGLVNGIALSKDGKTLYISQTAPMSRVIRYQIADNGTLTDDKVVIEYPAFQVDGLTVDAQGRIWLPIMKDDENKGKRVDVFNEKGERIAHFPISGEYPSDIALAPNSEAPTEAVISHFGPAGSDNGAYVEKVTLPENLHQP